MAEKTWQYFKKNPIFGLGLGSLEEKKFTHNKVDLSLGTPHNYWLELTTEQGIIIAVLYFYWIFKLITQPLIRNRNLRHLIPSLLVILLIPGGLILSSLYYFLPKWILLGCAACQHCDLDIKESLIINN